MTHELLLDGRLRQRGIFQQTEVTRLWEEHRSGQGDHRHRLWQLIMLELWFRAFIDTAGKQADAGVGAATTEPARVPLTA
jgi:asparagine synthetase B (glutamine-hydrolysing)